MYELIYRFICVCMLLFMCERVDILCIYVLIYVLIYIYIYLYSMFILYSFMYLCIYIFMNSFFMYALNTYVFIYNKLLLFPRGAVSGK